MKNKKYIYFRCKNHNLKRMKIEEIEELNKKISQDLETAICIFDINRTNYNNCYIVIYLRHISEFVTEYLKAVENERN